MDELRFLDPANQRVNEPGMQRTIAGLKGTRWCDLEGLTWTIERTGYIADSIGQNVETVVEMMADGHAKWIIHLRNLLLHWERCPPCEAAQ
jgi:hypothetical protein